MKKIIRILILSVVVLAFVSPQTESTQASKAAPLRAPNPRPSHALNTALTAAAEASDWLIECVDCPKQFEDKSDRSLQLDAAGHPHLVYGGDHLYYAHNDGSDWFLEIVDYAPGVGSNANLALDEQGNPHVLYQDYANSMLKYASADESAWQIQTIGSGWDGSLSLDTTGRPHIIYANQRGLAYAYLEDSQWITQTVDWDGQLGSLALDGEGKAHTSYFDASGLELRYASLEASGWVTQTLENQSIKYANSLAVDQSGKPHISYTTLDWIGLTKNPLLMYATPGTSSWQIDNVDSELVNPSISITLDQAGNPYVIYSTFTIPVEKHLTYAFRDVEGWQIETTSIQGGEDVSLALDASGTPQVSYYVDENSLRVLKYVNQDDQGWQSQTVDKAGQAGWNNALGLSTTGSANISYLNYAQGGLMFTSNESGSWQTQPAAAVGGSNLSMALDGADHPHISYDAVNHLRTYTYWDGMAWHSQPVDTAMDSEGALILDQSGQPHILYNKEESAPKYYYAGMVHAYRIDDSWQTEWVADIGTSISPAWAAQGLHISYVSGGLIYDGQLIDESAVGAVSLALDRDGIPHLSYTAWNEDHYSLRYASQGQTGWYTQTLDMMGVWDTSLALDQNGYPHISYAGGSPGIFEGVDLKYAYQDLTGWHFRTVYQGRVGESSLMLDEEDNPHISFYEDVPSADLRYTYHLGTFYEISLNASSFWVYGMPATSPSYTIILTNTGQESDIFEIAKSGSQWETTLPSTSASLGVGESAQIEIQVTIPPSATLGSSDAATITLTSKSDPSITAFATLTTHSAITTYLPLVEK